MKKKIKILVKNILLITLGCFLFALSFTMFLEPHLIAPGGFSGLSMAINYLTGFPIGIAIIIMNTPLILIASRKFGLKFIASTLYATVISSLFIDFSYGKLPVFTQDLLLASIYGGLLLGAGMGLVFMGGATTGGSDVLSKLVRLRYPHIKIGKIMLVVDALIIITCAFVFKNINLALYAVITLYASTIIIDMIMYGSDYAVLSYIISDKSEEIGSAIQVKLERGATYISGKGGHTLLEKQIILCVIRRNQATELTDLVDSIDPNAFMILTEAHQVFGYGFSPYKRL